MLEYDRIDISERIDVNKANLSNECDIIYIYIYIYIYILVIYKND